MSVADHVRAFNRAVASGGWATFCERFSDDAVLTFVGVPFGPFEGRAAIEAAYVSNPPDDTMSHGEVRAEGDAELADFRWNATGQTGTMRFVWAADGAVQRLTVSFD